MQLRLFILFILVETIRVGSSEDNVENFCVLNFNETITYEFSVQTCVDNGMRLISLKEDLTDLISRFNSSTLSKIIFIEKSENFFVGLPLNSPQMEIIILSSREVNNLTSQVVCAHNVKRNTNGYFIALIINFAGGFIVTISLALTYLKRTYDVIIVLIEKFEEENTSPHHNYKQLENQLSSNYYNVLHANTLSCKKLYNYITLLTDSFSLHVTPTLV